MVCPVNLNVLQANNVVAAALAESLAKPLPWAVGFFFGNPELSMELWTVIAGLSGLDDSSSVEQSHLTLPTLPCNTPTTPVT